MEDLDSINSSREKATKQLIDLAAVGVGTSHPVLFQGERFRIYERYLEILRDRDMLYECFCSRREIMEAASAPHDVSGVYPGICRSLSDAERQRRRSQRLPALRLRVDEQTRASGCVDDLVLRRNDGVPAYNLAVVVDDELQGVTQVVRGEDLGPITLSQNYLQEQLGFKTPSYVHVPLLRGPDGERLAKRHGDVRLADCLRLGFSGEAVGKALQRSLEVGSNSWGSSSSLSEWLRSLL
jgi:glutamyl-tRNA synthetase